MPSAGTAIEEAAAAKFVEDGDGVGCKPPEATDDGAALADGKAGAAELAAMAESFLDFHQAQRGPDWQPTKSATTLVNINA